ncbi:calcium/sodium antiporter [Pseudovibrio sp. Tun.PSC04-5.I4]|uniref:calcium/sodium antiporter n=1 Tax=Pseudovibrio sp. Tun.PSC04-5.I4 TaxID=1798213 RepID=UPI000883D94C|nr:calcium/sodium antiporter [Pseudovibrio sp. Tun.PSC04-5.I4]SDQ86117.1 cation:H+ antiporter [Pseudovibrio sp. Tun.PSC04-5.I4]
MHSLASYELGVLAIGAIGFGLFLLIKGGDWTIEAAAWIAEKSGLSKLFIAATIVAFGTSAPELFTSINANLSGFAGISLGNVVGSNIANVFMVIGISAMIMPIAIDRSRVRIDTIVMIIATVVLVGGVITGTFTRLMGLLMFAGIIGYVIYQYMNDSLGDDDEDADEEADFSGMGKAILTLALGFGAMVVGSEVLVRGAVAGGVALGVREAVIGMTVVAFGTSLPELSTCLAAARKGHSDMIIGGIVGSNIFNILSIVALTAIVKPLVAAPDFLTFDIPAVVVVTAIFAGFLFFMKSFGRLTGGLFTAGYVAFISFQYSTLFVG